jgi:hypothetical protein
MIHPSYSITSTIKIPTSIHHPKSNAAIISCNPKHANWVQSCMITRYCSVRQGVPKHPICLSIGSNYTALSKLECSNYEMQLIVYQLIEELNDHQVLICETRVTKDPICLSIGSNYMALSKLECSHDELQLIVYQLGPELHDYQV